MYMYIIIIIIIIIDKVLFFSVAGINGDDFLQLFLFFFFLVYKQTNKMSWRVFVSF